MAPGRALKQAANEHVLKKRRGGRAHDMGECTVSYQPCRGVHMGEGGE